MSGPDLQNRDPNGLHETSGDNPGLKSEFSDILGEPEHMHSIDCAWKTAYTCYTCGLAWAYKIVSLLCGVPMSLCWGCFYGCIGFKIIWVIVPAFRCYNMASYWLKQSSAPASKASWVHASKHAGYVFRRLSSRRSNPSNGGRSAACFPTGLEPRCAIQILKKG
eukprot:CAMPEP_0117036040 /NCGR_PEP_ID=MMETSP0472-20121206/25558_1 /TAXON_ID=693140 ORGANISM="Tiarina fusus, Strain LIS" /NCGR_SAMPLE_ID=MMETSP0472 /ASSEMBLY_ACC=CAM_ASM_000603 /LENGTH=163 /DNA_ID=CAMNT_0004745687 /DNA_START=5 /DNA_END=493 /DNA_ORIENTATION=+